LVHDFAAVVAVVAVDAVVVSAVLRHYLCVFLPFQARQDRFSRFNIFQHCTELAISGLFFSFFRWHILSRQFQH